MSFCQRGHRVVDSTGECVSVRQVRPGLYENVSGDCDVVEARLREDPTWDWADALAAAWHEEGRALGAGLTGCPRDLWTPRRKCAHCLAELLRAVDARWMRATGRPSPEAAARARAESEPLAEVRARLLDSIHEIRARTTERDIVGLCDSALALAGEVRRTLHGWEVGW